MLLIEKQKYYFFQNDMNGDPDFCRDILETRVKGILRDQLKISRDITFLQVNILDILETRVKGILRDQLKISRDITFLQVNILDILDM